MSSLLAQTFCGILYKAIRCFDFAIPTKITLGNFRMCYSLNKRTRLRQLLLRCYLFQLSTFFRNQKIIVSSKCIKISRRFFLHLMPAGKQNVYLYCLLIHLILKSNFVHLSHNTKLIPSLEDHYIFYPFKF